MSFFNETNMRGYTGAELRLLNAEFATRVAILAEDDNDAHGQDEVALDVLAEFHASARGRG